MENLNANRRIKHKNKLNAKNTILVLGLIYTLITILAITSYVLKMNSISTTVVTFSTVVGAAWWQMLMIVLFATCYVLYSQKPLLGILLEIVMSMSMLVYIVISVATMGIDLFALMIELIYPLILALHGLANLKKLNNKVKNKKSTI